MVVNTFISLKTSPFEMKFLLAVLSSKVELYREQDETVFSGGSLGAILLQEQHASSKEATSV